MNRRCDNDKCLLEASNKARTFEIDLPIASILYNPKKEWSYAGNGNVRIARDINIDWNKFSADKYLFSHCSIVSSCNVEENGYYVKAPTDELVNNNGNGWSDEVLLACFRSFVGAENYLEHCFVAGTRVLMANGTYQAIETIKPGDKIINRLGNIDVVKNVQIRKSTSLTKITSNGILSRDMYVTANHPFWVYHARETCPKTGRPNNPPDFSGLTLNKWTGFTVGVHKRKGEDYPCGLTPQWVDAGKINKDRDFLTHPVSSTIIENNEVNKNRAELIGWFLAEGSFTSQNIFNDGESGVQFALGNDECDVAERIKSLLITEFVELFRSDCEPRVYESESGSWCVSLCNIKVAEFFKKWCGKYAWAKQLNDAALWLPLELQALIMKHLINGDGTDKGESRGYSIELKTKALIQQLMFISWRLGMNPVYKETGVLPRYSEETIVDGYQVFVDPNTGKKSRPGYLLRFTVQDSKSLDEILNYNNVLIQARQEQKFTYVFEHENQKYITSKITEVSTIDLECDVFNLEVENDNSYIAEGVIVHNCQIPELSKGKILDAVLRPVAYTSKTGKKANVYYTDILVATDRKHSDLIRKIESGALTTMSMGCQANFTQCSKCGKEFTDASTNCHHLDNELMTYFVDENGINRIVAELCGRTIIGSDGKRKGDPKSCIYIEASWVERPAFQGAVLNHYISEVDTKKYANILSMSTTSLEGLFDDISRLRVADKNGMLALHVACAELRRRKEEQLINRVTIWAAKH
jgi:hypothetical protein